MLLITATTIALAAADVPAMQGVEAMLLAGLRERYPAVVRWNLKLFTQVVTTRTSGSSARVLLLGQRSAIQVGSKVYWYSVEGMQTVVSASRRIAAGEALDARAGQKVQVNVLASACEPLTDLARLQGSRAKKYLRPGEVICDQAIEPRPVVARGDSITVRYQGHSISLTTRGVAQSDAALGDTLNVKTLQGREVYPAVVSGAGEVTVHD